MYAHVHSFIFPDNGKVRDLGYYRTAKAAAKRYDEEALKLFNDPSVLNYKPDGTVNDHRVERIMHGPGN